MADQRVDFTRSAADRIAKAVRFVEQGQRDQTGTRFGRILDAYTPGMLRLGTFTGDWQTATFTTVKLHGSTVTASVYNWCNPALGGDTASSAVSRYVIFSNIKGTHSAVEIESSPPPAENTCGNSVANAVTLEFESCFGSGASATCNITGTCPGPIDDVTVNNPGAGYAVVARIEPVLTFSASSGTGATFTATYTETTDECGIPTWSIASISVSGGTGYIDGDKLTATVASGTFAVSAADLTLTVSNGVPTGVTVGDGGEFYKEDLDGTPYVATVTVTVAQKLPSDGSGATFTVVIDDDTASATFGQIASVTVDDGGDGYMDEVNQQSTIWNGLDFSTVPGYDGTKEQMLGHQVGGCLKWFDVITCEPQTDGVCCVEGDAAETTQAACEEVGGTFHLGAKLTDLPGPCCP